MFISGAPAAALHFYKIFFVIIHFWKLQLQKKMLIYTEKRGKHLIFTGKTIIFLFISWAPAGRKFFTDLFYLFIFFKV